MIWTKESLNNFIKEKLKDRLFIVVSNREPYMHLFKDGKIKCTRPISGLIAALDPVLRACNGLWVAAGTGDADKEVVDKNFKIRVPSDAPEYTLKRIWLTKEQEAKYYYGFANDSLWPLCHLVHVRPIFNSDCWQSYKEVNKIFAGAVLKEIKGKKALVWIQDYHFALLPKMIKEKRPDVNVVHFWHIPWPSPEVFRIFPWRKEMLEGMLANDVIGFQIPHQCRNFMETVALELGFKGHSTKVVAFPISIDYESVSRLACEDGVKTTLERLKKRLRIVSPFVSLGLDRLDYTKGILERIKAFDCFLERYPHLKKKVQHIEAGVLSRIYLDRYRDLNEKIQDLVEKINWKYSKDGWTPIVVLKEYKSFKEVLALYQLADLCIISSLHDGLNLVAKEYVAARYDLGGSIIVSEFAGVSTEFYKDALIFNPYDREGFADTIYKSYRMKKEEKKARMERLRKIVSENNIYKWTGQIISSLDKR